MNRALFLIFVGLGGAAILVALGLWQVQRLAWKQDVIANIEARILAAPDMIPALPDPTRDAYLPVNAEGSLQGDTLRVLVSQKDVGAGYRLITAFETGGRRVLVDRGFVPVAASDALLPTNPVEIIGNLQWPNETDSYTPEPDVTKNIWFARDVSIMAAALNTQPIMVVARSLAPSEAIVTPLPVDTTRIPNDHLQYAITWFSLAAIWLAMSVLFLRRRRAAPLSESKM